MDFKKAGDLLLFLDEPQIANLEGKMAKTGYLDGSLLKKTFSTLRSNDLIWSFVINNYLMGKEPFPFDLLYWNDDPTNMPREMHAFYLRNMYQKNKLIQPGGISIDGVDIDLSKIKVPCHFISTVDDHIAPWVATYDSARLLGGDVTFTLGLAQDILLGSLTPQPRRNMATGLTQSLWNPLPSGSKMHRRAKGHGGQTGRSGSRKFPVKKLRHVK